MGRKQCFVHVLQGNLAPTIHVDVTLTCTTHLSIVADHSHPLMEVIFSVVYFSFIMCPAARQKMVQQLLEEHNNEFEVLTWP